MIKILKPGTKKETTCDKCGALLSYDENEDVKGLSRMENTDTAGTCQRNC